MNSDTLVNTAEDYIEWFYSNREMIEERDVYGARPLEYSLHLKYPRQMGHTTALAGLFKKYNAWYLYDKQQMTMTFFDMIGIHGNRDHRSFNLNRPCEVKGRTLIQPHIILIDNWSCIDDRENKLSDFLDTAIPTVYGGLAPCPIVCMG